MSYYTTASFVIAQVQKCIKFLSLSLFNTCRVTANVPPGLLCSSSSIFHLCSTRFPAEISSFRRQLRNTRYNDFEPDVSVKGTGGLAGNHRCSLSRGCFCARQTAATVVAAFEVWSTSFQPTIHDEDTPGSRGSHGSRRH